MYFTISIFDFPTVIVNVTGTVPFEFAGTKSPKLLPRGSRGSARKIPMQLPL